MRVHLRGHFVTTRLATAHWRERRNAAGAPVYARIVNTSSEAFLLGSIGQPNYAAAKAGIAALTVTTARSCSRYGVRANAICPRARTAMTAELMGPPPDGADPLAPEHVAPLVVYLASPAAETINGEVFVVHGGVAAVMDPPRVRSVFRAGTPDGMWTLDSVQAALGPAFEGGAFGAESPGTGRPRWASCARTRWSWPPRPSGSPGGDKGRTTRTDRPPSGWLRTSSSAPCAVLTDRSIDSPRPTPPSPRPSIRRNEGVGQFLELVPRPGQGQSLPQVLVRGTAGGLGDRPHRPQYPAGDEPAQAAGGDGHHPQAEQREKQQAVQGPLAHAGRARPGPGGEGLFALHDRADIGMPLGSLCW